VRRDSVAAQARRDSAQRARADSLGARIPGAVVPTPATRVPEVRR
jgi:hypothetical protein